jgi:hypothetical protein
MIENILLASKSIMILCIAATVASFGYLVPER